MSGLTWLISLTPRGEMGQYGQNSDSNNSEAIKQTGQENKETCQQKCQCLLRKMYRLYIVMFITCMPHTWNTWEKIQVFFMESNPWPFVHNESDALIIKLHLVPDSWWATCRLDTTEDQGFHLSELTSYAGWSINGVYQCEELIPSNSSKWHTESSVCHFEAKIML